MTSDLQIIGHKDRETPRRETLSVMRDEDNDDLISLLIDRQTIPEIEDKTVMVGMSITKQQVKELIAYLQCQL